ncbi:sigma-70 region 4 domain-containing protein [Candidatus Woesearchaeota archaeon]|nr:sigma-70 region 4 domain-containing protein [Candidatus Woesearchaeota archaeon]MBT5396974.1 sigma-70 region 4 domain-containing protein [Candidatus Woesearchaeota archaeon]MBT6367167.1 sigma-70 region 4 domain-containing protein [Candidatus Woesearchaeota archaeon]MBT7762259.1 sigma-70 region 4 domain-containing protein [Candidatus Woesearchaeota archaeon]
MNILLNKNIEVAVAMKKGFDVVRTALEEHLSSINENTSEIQALFDYLHELDVKIDKLSQRVDQTQLTTNPEEISVSPLTSEERTVFLALYTEEEPLSYQEIAEKTNMSISLVPECVSSLIQKGVPLNRSYCNNHIFFQINKQFKERQAKENVINLSLHSFI